MRRSASESKVSPPMIESMINALEVKERLLDAGLCSPDMLVGCSKAELEELERQAGQKLPTAYVELLKIIGHGAGDFMSDVDMFYPGIKTLTERTRQWMLEEQIDLPDDAFVIADRYGEQILFFRLKHKANPQIYRWCFEEPEEFTKVYDSVWAFIEEELEGHEWQAG